MGREFELKYAANEAVQTALAAAFGPFETIEMATTYYDTPDGALSARRMTLRRRMENELSVCTVKTPAQDGSRGEWEVPCDRILDAVEKLCKLGAPEELAALTADGVVEVCGARFTRRAAAIYLPECTLELALDAGVLLGGGKEEALCEVELELKSGSETAAVAYAQGLAKKYGLRPESRSKFRRALALAKGE